LGDVVDSSQGITVYAKVQGEKIDYFRTMKVSEYSRPVTKGREIFKYENKWTGGYIEYGKWLWCPRDKRYFESPKILLRQTAADIIATYTEDEMYCVDSVHSLITRNPNFDLKYILGILNSTFGNYLYHLLISEQGKVFAQVKLTFLRQIPIKCAISEQQKNIIDLVDKIMAAKKADSAADTSALESEIDTLVYDLYGLTPTEIAIIEGK
jgi:hypothetical protein